MPFVPWDDGNGETDDPWDSLTDEEILGFSDPAEPYQEGSCPRGDAPEVADPFLVSFAGLVRAAA